MALRKELQQGFQLGEWTIRPEDGSIVSASNSRRLEPLVMDLLVFLCSRAGQVVSKEVLIAEIWQGRFVSDDTIKASFYQLRKALRDEPRNPRFIETIPKRGYRVLLTPKPLGSIAPAGKQLEEQDDEWFRKGQAALSEQPSAESLKQAKLYFERCIESHPRHANALSGLSQTLLLMLTLGLGSGSELLPQAKAAALRSLEADPDQPVAHVALGVVHALYHHDLDAAEREFRTAIQLAPSEPLAHRWLARLLSSGGRHQDAIAECRLALQLDPLFLLGRRELMEVLFLARRYDDVLAEAGQLSSIGGISPEIQLGLVWVYYFQQNQQAAMDAFRSALRSLGTGAGLLEQATAAFQKNGMHGVFRVWAEILDQMRALGRKSVDLPALYALLGKKNLCLDYLEPICDEAHPYLLTIAVSPFYDTLQSEPRYQRLVKRLGLSKAWQGAERL